MALSDSLTSTLSSTVGDVVGDLAGAFLGPSSSDPSLSDIQKNQGIRSSMQGSNPPPAFGGRPPSSVTGSDVSAESADSGAGKDAADAFDTIGSAIHHAFTGTVGSAFSQAGSKLVDRVLNGSLKQQMQRQGRASRAFAASFMPQGNSWDRMGAAPAAGSALSSDLSTSNDRTLANTNNSFQRANAFTARKTALQTAGVNSVTSRRNLRDTIRMQQPLINAQIAQANATTSATLSNTALNPARSQQIKAATAAADASATASKASADQARANTALTVANTPGAIDAQSYPGATGDFIRNFRSIVRDNDLTHPFAPVHPHAPGAPHAWWDTTLGDAAVQLSPAAHRVYQYWLPYAHEVYKQLSNLDSDSAGLGALFTRKK